MKLHSFFLVALALTLGCAVQAGQQPITREIRQARTRAVNDLSRTLPCKFITQKTLLDALAFIEKELKPNVHQELLRLQMRAGELYDQRESILAIDGITEDHEAVKAVDRELVKLEKKLDDMLYNSGLFNWKSMLALAVGTGVGAGVAHHSKSTMGKKAGITIATALIVAILLEYSLRGRRSVLAGNMYSGLRFIFGVVGKFFSKLCGHGGYFDKFGAYFEKAFRNTGKKLDSIFGTRTATITITTLSLMVVALSVGWMVREIRRAPRNVAGGNNSKPTAASLYPAAAIQSAQ